MAIEAGDATNLYKKEYLLFILNHLTMKRLESLRDNKFCLLTEEEKARCWGGYHVEGALFGWSWNGDATERQVGSVTKHSEAKLAVFSGGNSATANCYQYDYNGLLNGHYISTGWSETSCLPYPS